MISKIKLRGWKSHLDSEFNFSNGVNALIGIMGSGKSSVTDAISFGLFGTFPALQGRKVLLDELIMDRPQKKGEAFIEIDFVIDENKYNVKRFVKKGKGSNAEIRENGVLKEVSSKTVTKEIERILGMDYDVFSKAVYSEQNGIDYFLKIPSGKRREHIDKMLRVDRFETVRSEAVGLQNKIKIGREEKLRITGEMEKENFPERIKEVEKDIDEFNQDVKKLSDDAEAYKIKRKEIEEKLSGFEEKEKEFQRTKQLLEGLKGGLEQVSISEGRSRKIVRGRDLGNIDIEIKRLEEGIEKRKEEIENLKEDLHSNKTRKKVTNENLEDITNLEDKCPLCDSSITSEKKDALVKNKEKLLIELEENIAKKHSIVFQKEREMETLDKNLDEKKIERQRVSDAYREIKELGDKLKEIMNTKKMYENRLKELEHELKDLDIKDLREGFEDIVSKETETRVKIDSLKERLEDREETKKDLVKRNELLTKYKKELEQGETITKHLEGFEKALKLTQDGLRKEFLKNVNSILENIWSELYPYGDFESARLSVDGGDYILQLKAGEWINAEGIVSGGERSLACLALRIAFSLAFLPNLRWLILDEPTHNLDSNAINAFSLALREKIPEFAGQVFLITHDSSISEGLENVYRLERNKEKGEATIVNN